MIAIIDNGLGNAGSILNMLNRLGAKCKLTSKPSDLEEACKIILPGVGAFDDGIGALKSRGILEVLNDAVLQQKKPFLGICLGMQLILQGSDEGKLPGLGWISGRCVKFSFAPSETQLKVPHMGWAGLDYVDSHVLFKGMPRNERFYFVHSYHAVCDDSRNTLAMAKHGYEFVAAIQFGNIYGVQFHPEKSLKWGMHIMRKFAEDV